MIENFEYVTSLLSDSSSLVSDDLNQLAVMLVQGGQESWLKWNGCYPCKFSIDLYKTNDKHKLTLLLCGVCQWAKLLNFLAS